MKRTLLLGAFALSMTASSVVFAADMPMAAPPPPPPPAPGLPVVGFDPLSPILTPLGQIVDGVVNPILTPVTTILTPQPPAPPPPPPMAPEPMMHHHYHHHYHHHHHKMYGHREF